MLAGGGHHRRWRPEDGRLPPVTSKSSEEVEVVEVVEVDGQLHPSVSRLKSRIYRPATTGEVDRRFRRARDAGYTPAMDEVPPFSRRIRDQISRFQNL